MSAQIVGPVLVLHVDFDIFRAGTEIVRSRFPRAARVTLEDSGDVHWLLNPSGYAVALGEFHQHVAIDDGPIRTGEETS
jgi:hypothetical protein